MLIEAMKSAGPKMIVSTRGEAAAMASTLISPSAFSICASMPIRPDLEPVAFSIWVSSRSSATTCSAVCTFGSMIAVEVRPGTLDDLDHVAIGPLRGPVVDPHGADLVAPPPSFSAATMFLRASGLASGATASSMSRKTWSAGSPLALSIILVLDPGTARLERRDRSGRAAGCVVMAPEATDAGDEPVTGLHR